MANIVPTTGAQREKLRGGWFSVNNKEINNHTSAGHTLSGTGQQRRDMFADEDTRNFSVDSLYAAGRDGGGGSSWSLQSMSAAIGSVATGIRGMLSRENSVSGRSIHREASGPFSDGTSLIREGEFNPHDMAVIRPHARREASYTSMARSYRDPFMDHPIEDAEKEYHDLNPYDADADESTSLTYPLSSRTTSPPTIGIHTLPPLTEQTSRTTDPSSSSSEHRSSPLEPDSSFSSFEYNSRRRRSSIINTNTQPMRRSDSWWARFAKTSILDRKSSDTVKISPMEFRDPNPAPRLVTIQEASPHSQSPDSPQPQSWQNKPSHRKSISSVQTTKTADSEAIERMGGMDVIQRIGTSHSHQTTSSTGRDTPERDLSWSVPSPLSAVASSGLSGESQLRLEEDSTVESPVNMTHIDSLPNRSNSDASSQSAQSSSSKRPILGGNVLDRVQAYERKMSQDMEGLTSPGSPLSPGARTTRKKEEHPSKTRVTVNYGLAPRPSLFVANPDHKMHPSSDS
jgi:hypothetical protein